MSENNSTKYGFEKWEYTVAWFFYTWGENY